MNSKIVLDSNVLLVSIPRKSKYRKIFDALTGGEIDLIISNEILLEYIEILEQKTNHIIAKNICGLLLSLSNVTKVDVFFRWSLIKSDPDDNKFVDCAIAGNADYLVTNDKHFREVIETKFPSIEIINANEFLKKVIDK